MMLALNHAASTLPDAFWGALTISGLGWSVLILVSIMHRHDAGARAVIAAFVLGGLVTHGLKPWLALPRPGKVIPPEMLHFIGSPVINFESMPSGHSLAALAMGSLWVCLLRAQQGPKALTLALMGLAWTVAILIALSRIAVGAHWPADVLVGAGLGLWVGRLAWRLAQAWPARQMPSFPWLAAGIELLGAWAAFTFNEGMPAALLWQHTLGLVAVLSVLWRIRAGYKERAARAPL